MLRAKSGQLMSGVPPCDALSRSSGCATAGLQLVLRTKTNQSLRGTLRQRAHLVQRSRDGVLSVDEPMAPGEMKRIVPQSS